VFCARIMTYQYHSTSTRPFINNSVEAFDFEEPRAPSPSSRFSSHADLSSSPLRLRGGASRRIPRNKRKYYLGGSALLLAVIVAAVVGGVVGSRSSDTNNEESETAAQDSVRNVNNAAQSPSEDPAPAGASTGGDGSVVITEDGSSFIYNNSYGGFWVSTPFDDSARPRNDTPALNETWDYSTDLINGVNLGGWLLTEPFIVPGLYEAYDGAVDEYTLSDILGSNLTAVMTEHYETFITEQDFAQIAGAGLNWIRLPIPFWFIETYDDEPFLEGVGWEYFLKALAWARKYGLRIELDLHAVPGSQNGQNHSGRIGSVGFLNGVMGVTNGQRAISYIQTLVQFISQPEYQNVVTMFHPVNEPYATTFGEQVLRQFYLEAYETIRNITGTGEGNGALIALSDGFLSQTDWYDFLPGADRVALETHYYLAFSPDSYPDGIGPVITRPCQWWSGAVNTTYNEFGFALGGEWSLATNDCGQYLNGVGLGARYDGSYEGSTRVGSCDPFTDASRFSDAYKLQLRQLMRSYQDGIRNWFFWTWKVGPNALGIVPNPLWSYSLGLEQNYIPADPRPTAYLGSCASNANTLGLPGQQFVEWTPPLAASATGGLGAGSIAASATAPYAVWPPTSITNFPQATNLPRLTPTGTPITMPATPYPLSYAASGSAVGSAVSGPAPTGLPTGGWANSNATQPYNVKIPGCTYLNAYSGVGQSPPPACTAA